MLYVDTSAAVKLLVEEEESRQLEQFLDAGELLITSRVGIVELRRVARRIGASPDRSDALAASLSVLEVDEGIETIAVGLDPRLRTLDALHLASALSTGTALRGFVCYDHRLAAAAAGEGLSVLAPTASDA